MATVSNRFQFPLGQAKLEVLHLTSVTTADTVATLMQRPVFALGVPSKTGAATNTQVTISGKTLTITNADLDGDDSIDVLVFGF